MTNARLTGSPKGCKGRLSILDYNNSVNIEAKQKSFNSVFIFNFVRVHFEILITHFLTQTRKFIYIYFLLKKYKIRTCSVMNLKAIAISHVDSASKLTESLKVENRQNSFFFQNRF